MQEAAATEIEVSVLDGGRRVAVAWPQGERRVLPARWIFDHAAEARDPVSGQRRHGALALADVVVWSARIEGDDLVLDFADGDQRHAPLARLAQTEPPRRRDLWLTPELVAGCAPIDFADYLADDGALALALKRVARGGLALLTGAGPEPEAVARAVARFGYVRETNYGRVFDVRVEAEPGNLAFTEHALDLHADNPYRDPLPTLQLLHAIQADGAGGGETVFVDGFAHAEALRREAPAAFELLARQPVRFSFTEPSGARLSARAPVLQLDAAGELQAIRLNHRSLDIPAVEAQALEPWYEAYLRFYRAVHAPGGAYGRRLAQGELVIFDNRRILHGRRAFARGGARWLRGAYADLDGMYATLARLETVSIAAG